MATFDEYVAIAQNESNPRTIGIYPEAKTPEFFNGRLQDNGTTMEDLMVTALEKYGWLEIYLFLPEIQLKHWIFKLYVWILTVLL